MDLYRQLHEIMMQRCGDGEQQNGYDFESQNVQNQHDAAPLVEQPADQIVEPPRLPPPIIMLSPTSSFTDQSLPAASVPTTSIPRGDPQPKSSSSKIKEKTDKTKSKSKESKKEKSNVVEKKSTTVTEKSHKPERPKTGETSLSGIRALDSSRLEISLKNSKFEIYDMKV